MNFCLLKLISELVKARLASYGTELLSLSKLHVSWRQHNFPWDILSICLNPDLLMAPPERSTLWSLRACSSLGWACQLVSLKKREGELFGVDTECWTTKSCHRVVCINQPTLAHSLLPWCLTWILPLYLQWRYKIAELSHILTRENCWQVLMHVSLIMTAIHLWLVIT